VVIGLPRRWWFEQGAFGLRLVYVGRENRRDRARNFVLDCEDILQFSVVALRPAVCPVPLSTSCALIRTLSPPRRMLPSRAYRTPSSRPTWRTSTALPLYLKLELRAITNKSEKRDNSVIMSSETGEAWHAVSFGRGL
jgi:hypothetical protein